MSTFKPASLVVILLTLFVVAIGSANATPFLNLANGHYYDVVSVPYMTWHEARIAASELTHGGYSGHLATVTSQAENAFIVNTFDFAALTNKWLGAFQADASKVDDGWEWITGEAWSYTSWNGGEPNNLYYTGYSYEDALTYWSNGLWNDAPSAWNQYASGGYVVEFSPVPEPASMLLLGAGLVGLAAFRKRIRKG